VGGSIASGAYGVSRATQGVDLVVDLSPEEAFVLATRLEGSFSVDAGDARDAIARNRPFNLIPMGTAFKFDIFPATFFAHGEDELCRRRMVEGTGDSGRPGYQHLARQHLEDLCRKGTHSSASGGPGDQPVQQAKLPEPDSTYHRGAHSCPN